MDWTDWTEESDETTTDETDEAMDEETDTGSAAVDDNDEADEDETAAATVWLELAVIALALPGVKDSTPVEVGTTVSDMSDRWVFGV